MKLPRRHERRREGEKMKHGYNAVRNDTRDTGRQTDRQRQDRQTRQVDKKKDRWDVQVQTKVR